MFFISLNWWLVVILFTILWELLLQLVLNNSKYLQHKRKKINELSNENNKKQFESYIFALIHSYVATFYSWILFILLLILDTDEKLMKYECIIDNDPNNYFLTICSLIIKSR